MNSELIVNKPSGGESIQLVFYYPTTVQVQKEKCLTRD